MDEKEKQYFEEMLKVNELNFHGKLESFRGTIQFGIQTTKSLFMVSGGAAAALLAFMGHLVTNDRVAYAKLLVMPLGVFFVAAIFSCGTFAFSYLTQHDATMENEKMAGRWRVASIIFTFLAFVTLFVGIFVSYKAFMSF